MHEPRTLTIEDVRSWLVAYLSKLLGVEETEVRTSHSFEAYGLDSSAAVGLSGDLGDLVGRELDTSVAYDHPTIDALVAHLAAKGLVT